MSALKTMIRTETKIFAREPMAVFWGLVFPSVLLVVLGLVLPGAREPSPDLGGLRVVDLYTPIVLGFALITLGISTLPTILATYRERGVLKRLATTPVAPSRMVVSQLAVHLLVAVISGFAALVVAWAVFDVPFPQNPWAFVLTFLLGAASLFGIGLVIGAVAPSAASGQGIGMAAYFPLLFFAGVYFPREVMPEGLARVSDFTPSGALVQALTDSFAGRIPAVSSLAIMAAFAAVFGFLAVRLFRWE